jgi:hypothetical protein
LDFRFFAASQKDNRRLRLVEISSIFRVLEGEGVLRNEEEDHF